MFGTSLVFFFCDNHGFPQPHAVTKPGLRGVVGREETDGFRAPHCLLRGTLGRATDQNGLVKSIALNMVQKTNGPADLAETRHDLWLIKYESSLRALFPLVQNLYFHSFICY